MRRRRQFTKEFKASAIELYLSSGRTAKEIAEELGFDRSNLGRWLKEKEEAEAKQFTVFPGQGNPRDEEVARLRKEVADLRETNEILKKAMAFFVVKKPH
jgi:transposase